MLKEAKLNRIEISFLKELKEIFASANKQLVDSANKLKATNNFIAFNKIKNEIKQYLKNETQDRFGKIFPPQVESLIEEFFKNCYELELIVSKKGIQSFDIDGVKVVLFGKILSEEKYAAIAQKTYQLLQTKGLQSAWYGEIYVISHTIKNQVSKDDLKNYAAIGIDIQLGSIPSGEYDDNQDKIFLTANDNSPSQMTDTLLHELGHRFYYKILSKPVRLRWADLLNTQTHSYDQPGLSGKKMMSGKPSPIKAVSTYGKTNADEAFAEAFLYYCTNKKISPEQLTFFKKTISNISESLLKEMIKESIITAC